MNITNNIKRKIQKRNKVKGFATVIGLLIIAMVIFYANALTFPLDDENNSKYERVIFDSDDNLKDERVIFDSDDN